MAVVKDVVSKFKASLKGKPILWFEMQYPTSADEPKTEEAYEKMIASFITEHNTIGSTREQQIMAWKTLNWDPVQERFDDFVYRLRRIGQELGKTADEQLDYFKCSVPQHLYLYHKDATTIKEAMENIKRACALGGVPVVAPVDTSSTQSVPFCKQPFLFLSYAKSLSSANCFFLFLCRMLLALFAGFLVPSCPKLALVFGECL